MSVKGKKTIEVTKGKEDRSRNCCKRTYYPCYGKNKRKRFISTKVSVR